MQVWTVAKPGINNRGPDGFGTSIFFKDYLLKNYLIFIEYSKINVKKNIECIKIMYLQKKYNDHTIHMTLNTMI